MHCPRSGRGGASIRTAAAWSYGILADGYALGLFGDEIYTDHSQVVTLEQVTAMADLVADKLAPLGVAPRTQPGDEALVLDTTRGGVVNALYQAAGRL